MLSGFRAIGLQQRPEQGDAPFFNHQPFDFGNCAFSGPLRVSKDKFNGATRLFIGLLNVDVLNI